MINNKEEEIYEDWTLFYYHLITLPNIYSRLLEQCRIIGSYAQISNRIKRNRKDLQSFLQITTLPIMLEFTDKLVQAVTIDRYLLTGGNGSAQVKIAEVATLPKRREADMMR